MSRSASVRARVTAAAVALLGFVGVLAGCADYVGDDIRAGGATIPEGGASLRDGGAESIEINDRVMVNKLAYRFGEPQQGDIVVFLNPNLTADSRRR